MARNFYRFEISTAEFPLSLYVEHPVQKPVTDFMFSSWSDDVNEWLRSIETLERQLAEMKKDIVRDLG